MLIDLLLGSGESGVWLSAGEAVSGLITDRGRVAFDLKLPLISEAMPNGEWRMALSVPQWFLSWVCYIRSLREDAMKDGERGHLGAFSPL